MNKPTALINRGYESCNLSFNLRVYKAHFIIVRTDGTLAR